MTGFFGSLINGTYYTLKAMSQELPSNYDELLEAQRDRMYATTDVIINKDYSPEDIIARKQYWHSQLLFLTQLPVYSEMLNPDQRDPAFFNRSSVFNVINLLMSKLDKDEFLEKFLLQVKTPPTEPAPVKPANQAILDIPRANLVIKDDVANQIHILSRSGRYVIVNDAANSHRDGASKIAKGTVEERIGQFTNGAVSLATHFADVHRANKGSHIKGKIPPIDVADFQRRYLKMVLTIMKKMILDDQYLESPEFFDDLLNSYPSKETGIPIYFEMQDTAYQVPTKNGFFSERQFQDTNGLTNLTEVFNRLGIPSYPVGVTSFAAPDLRKVVAAPLDARCTSDPNLANSAKEGSIATMMHKGISYQCEKAIEEAKKKPERPVHVLFILQGCGAFLNPERIAAANFVSTIKAYEKQFEEHNINFNIVEFDERKSRFLTDTYNEVGTELYDLNLAIENMKIPFIKNRAIAVRERILELYDDGASYKELKGLMKSTTRLLNCQKGSDLTLDILQFKNTVHAFHQDETLYTAMRRLFSSIARIFFTDRHLDKDLALKESADELVISSRHRI